MLSTLLFTNNDMAAAAITEMLGESNVLSVVLRTSPTLPVYEIIRLSKTYDPHVILLDSNNLKDAAFITQQIRATPQLRAVIIGFRPGWTPAEELALQNQGMQGMLPEPFGWKELEPVVYDSIHQRQSIHQKKFLAFLPAKAGGGCSTVALNTAGALAGLGKRVLLMDSDRRSGIISVLLNLTKRNGLLDALRNSSELTGVEWERNVVRALGMDLLLADPAVNNVVPTWADYYLLLRFLDAQYDQIVIDLPELVNPATVEVVRSAGSVFVVCTPEIPSLRLAEQRCRELASCGIPETNVHILLNRETREGMKMDAIQRLVGRPVFATLSNDYAAVHESILASRLVAADSAFSKGCQQLARRAAGLEPAEQAVSRFGFLRAFSLAS